MTQPAPDYWRAIYGRVQQVILAEGAVANARVYPRWIAGDQFWYERTTEGKTEYRVVDASTGLEQFTFAQRPIADALSRTLGAEIDSEILVLKNLQVRQDLASATFDAFGDSWQYDLRQGLLTQAAKTDDRNWLLSPDGKSAAFLRSDNLWVREIATGQERALTSDGAPAYAYASLPLATRSTLAQIGARPEARWSPDSKLIFTLQTDDRHVPELSLIDFAPTDDIRPKVRSSRFSLPADDKPTEFRMVCIDTETARQTEARHPRLPAVRMNDTPFAAGLAWWSADSRTAWFVDIERGEKSAHVVAFDVLKGSTRTVFSETAATCVELSVNVYTSALVFALPETEELVWYSERSGHGHLYLYDLRTGIMKRPITSGPWQVRDVHHVDALRRQIFFTAAGIAPQEEPYICKPCIASLDNADLRVLADEPGDHIVWRPGEYGLISPGLLGHDVHQISGTSPTGDYFVETIGRIDALPRTVLRSRSGEEIAVLEIAADVGLPEGWQWPEAVRLKAADGVTDTYGLLFKPFGYDPQKTYPVIDYIYGGPQVSYTPKSAFAGSDLNGVYMTAASFAALGAFALVLDGRGTANRERAFRDASSGAIQTASNLEDHIAGIRQLADRYPGLDADRAGIAGFSGGGYMAAIAALRYGAFFKVSVAGGGNYDQALFWHSWGERYHGAFDAEHYKSQAAKSYADGLVGKLMIVHGMLDDGCHPAAVFQLLQALIEEDKDVDLVLLPRAGHKLTSYGERRRLDYFVEHLFDSVPPTEVRLTTPSEELDRRMAINAAPPNRARAAHS
jgi:dipeptidyl-peptidase 4